MVQYSGCMRPNMIDSASRQRTAVAGEFFRRLLFAGTDLTAPNLMHSTVFLCSSVFTFPSLFLFFFLILVAGINVRQTKLASVVVNFPGCITHFFVFRFDLIRFQSKRKQRIYTTTADALFYCIVLCSFLSCTYMLRFLHAQFLLTFLCVRLSHVLRLTMSCLHQLKQ